MATFNTPIDASWANATLTFSGIQGGSQLATGAATISALAGGVYKATGTVDLSSGSAGDVDVVLADASGNVAWSGTYYMNDAGEIQSTGGSIASIETSGTVTAEDVDENREFRFPRSGKSNVSGNHVEVLVGFAGDISFDVTNVMHKDATIASVSSAAVSDSGATVGTIRLHTSKKKFLVPLSSVSTTGSFTVSATFVSTDSQTIPVRGTMTVGSAT